MLEILGQGSRIMGTREKAKRFLQTSETLQMYSEIVDYALMYFIARAEKEKNRGFADELKRAKETYREDFRSALEITEEVYCEIFSDEELKELIVIHSTPAMEKLRGLAPKIMGKFFEKYSRRIA